MSAPIHHRDGKLMDITFASDASGEWKEIGGDEQQKGGQGGERVRTKKGATVT